MRAAGKRERQLLRFLALENRAVTEEHVERNYFWTYCTRSNITLLQQHRLEAIMTCTVHFHCHPNPYVRSAASLP